MSQIKYLYTNLFDSATLTPSSELTQMPVENVQRDIIGTVWQTQSYFTVASGMNDTMGVLATATGSVSVITATAGQYTGEGLAGHLQNLIRTATTYNLGVAYTGNTFQFGLGSGTASVLSIYFDDYASSTIATDIGFDPYTDYTGETSYTGTVSLSGQDWIQATIPSGSSTHIILDGYNMASGTSVLIRLADSTSTFSGLRGGGSMSASVTVSLNADRTVYELSSTFSGQGVQLSWKDGSVAYSRVGRVWMGKAFIPEDRIDNGATWAQKKIDRRSKAKYAYGAAVYFDKQEPAIQYTITTEALDPYYNNVTKLGYEAMLDDVGDTKSFYTIFSTASDCVYGFIVGDTIYNRIKNSTVVELRNIIIQEQK